MAMARVKVRGDTLIYGDTQHLSSKHCTMVREHWAVRNEASAPVPATVSSSVICNIFKHLLNIWPNVLSQTLLSEEKQTLGQVAGEKGIFPRLFLASFPGEVNHL